MHSAVFGEALRAARESDWLSRQPPDFSDALLRGATPQRWSKGDAVIAIEERGTALHFLLHGAIEVSVPSPSLEITPVHVIPGRCWFGEHSALTGSPSSAEYRALVQSYCLSIPRATVIALATAHSGGMAALMDLLNLSHRTQLQLTADLMRHTSEQRVRARLHTMSGLAAAGLALDEVTLAICHEELAAITCTSRSTICKVLNELQHEKIISRGYREIRVLRRHLLPGPTPGSR